MKILGNVMEHVRLVSRMGKATRTDLVGAFDAGTLSSADWADMVQTCRGCTWAERCPDWLDRHDAVECAPGSCLNRQRFEALGHPATGPRTSEV